jgi:prevent-host-death family protein
MKIESLREVKAKLSQIVKELPEHNSVVITKNGKPCAILLPVTEETDLEALLLSQRKDFWALFDRAHTEGTRKGAAGCARATSDVDLGFLVKGANASERMDSIRVEAMRLLGTDRIDAIDLRRAPPLLAMAVTHGGRVLHEARPGVFASFASLSLRRYADTAKFRRLREAGLRRFADQSARGIGPARAASR